MVFLAPWYLLGLALVPALLVWGVVAPRGRRVTVGSLVLWRRALRGGSAGRPSARLRLRDPVLWLDAAAVLLVVLACARPALRTARPLEPVATVVVDRTASMRLPSDRGEGTRWTDTLAMLGRALAAVPDAPVRCVCLPDPAGTVRARRMSTARLRQRVSDPPPALAACEDFWALVLAEAGRAGDRPVLVATDTPPGAEADLPGNVHVLAPQTSTRNAGLERVACRVERDRWYLLVCARAAPGARPCGLRVASGGGVMRSIAEFLRPGATGERVLAFDGRPPTRLTVVLSEAADGFDADDTAYLVRVPGRPVRVLLIGEGDEAVERAFAARRDVTVVHGGGDAAEPGEFDLVVAVRTTLPAGWNGPAAVVLPPAAVGPVRPAGEAARAEWTVSPAHPLAEALYLPAPHLQTVRRYGLGQGADVLAGTRAVPLIVTWETGGARRLAVLFGLDDATTDWPRRAGFPVFWSRAVDWLVPEGTRPPALATRRPADLVVGDPRATGPVTPGFHQTPSGPVAISFIGTGEGFEAGPGRDDSEAAAAAVRRSVAERREASFARAWPFAAALVLMALVARAWVAR